MGRQHDQFNGLGGEKVSEISTTYTKTIQEIIDSSSKKSERNTGELGKDDFLNLLVTQLRYQDPLSPTDNTEFIGQMAQFSALEQMQNLNNSFTGTMAYSLIGKGVIATTEKTEGKEVSRVSGTVTGVSVDNGKYYLVIDDTITVPAENTLEVYESDKNFENTLSAYTGIIGRNVNGIVYDSSNGSMIKVSGTVSSLQKGVYEDYMVLNNVQAEISGLYNNKVYTDDQDYLTKFLTDAVESGDTVSIVITDSSTGQKVPVSAKIRSFDASNPDSIKAVLDDVHAPLDSITSITDAASTASAAGSSDAEQTASQAADDSE